MQIEARLEIITVVISSVGESSPSWRFPIKRTAQLITR